MDAFIAGVAYHLPDEVLTNDQLQAENPDWDMARIGAKVGVKARRVVQADECASDLGFMAAEKLLNGMNVDRASIDCLLFCTQSPDYFLPATACTLQNRLGLPSSCAALDFNQGCSGYIYGLYLAKSLVSSGMAQNVLLVTAETYSKFIHPRDRTVRVLFGDAATATLINANPSGAKIGEITLGTDGAGAANLMVPAGGCRTPHSAETGRETTDEKGSIRSPENLYMDGQELFLFSIKRVPEVVKATLGKANLSVESVDWFVFHQANAFMNEHLVKKLRIPAEKAPMFIEQIGNTVSNTIPITLWENGQRMQRHDKVMLVGFGVGYSWGACLLEWNDVRLV